MSASPDLPSQSLRRPLPTLVGDLLAWGIFFLALAWGSYELFGPSRPSGALAPPGLRPEREPPDPLVLQARIRHTPPAPRQPEWRAERLSNRWQWIVIHHSATLAGNAAAFDAYHLREKDMENGLGYHFVIGNGSGSEDGQVEVGRRWREQLDGGHTAGKDPATGRPWNQIAIGICLVGDFEHYMPTAKQIASLKALLCELMSVLPIDEQHVKGHNEFRNTDCPGRYLPVGEIVRWRNHPVLEPQAPRPEAAAGEKSAP
ncbi:MAG: peptidoglycan recognition protein family protein [Planctomycetota bacterium]|nr:peptidoglycan recognition protein family protein [Planctomycetota bacterium]